MEVMEEIRSGEISAVIVGGCDTSGVYRGKRLSAARFLRSAESAMKISEYTFAIDIGETPQPRPGDFQGWWPTFETGMADIDAVIDLTTLRRVPWQERTALVLCDYRQADGRAYEFSPRQVLKRVLKGYERHGLEPSLAPEFEFVLFEETERSVVEKGFRNLQPLYAKTATMDTTRATLDNHILEKVINGLTALGVPVEAWNSEATPGQYEVNVEHAPALEAADRGFLFKLAVREIVALEGMLATFMSKLNSAHPGNSMHVHQSLWKDGASPFYDPDSADRMSSLMRSFIAGQLRTLIPFAPIWMPNPAAFKRPAPYMGAGGSESWGGDNRMLSLRVLTGDAGNCRVEHRLSGADANIYLAFAAMLAGGLYGIENELELPEPTTGDAHAQTDLKTVPTTIDAALGAFEESPVANEYLGEEFVRRYAATRRWEEEQARKEITDWELERYLIRS